MQTIEQLRSRFGQYDSLSFESMGATSLIRVKSFCSTALISMKGAQILEYIHHDHSNLLWLSPEADVGGTKPTRGGIPVCWPWFADHPADPASKPLHGFARTAPWSLTEAEASSGVVRLRLEFETSALTATLWPYSAHLILDITVGETLSLVSTTHNTGTLPFSLTQALHAYFRVGDITDVSVTGLDGRSYLDKVDAFACKQQSGPLTFGMAVDRIFVDTTDAVSINDRALGRQIEVSKSGSASTVVWNPGADRAMRMGDLGSDGWRRFVCVETANAGNDVITLPAGECHVLSADYAQRPLA